MDESRGRSCFLTPTPLKSKFFAPSYANGACTCGVRMTVARSTGPAVSLSRRALLTTLGAVSGSCLLAPALEAFAGQPTVTPGKPGEVIVAAGDYEYSIPESGFTKNIASLNGGRIATIWVDESDGDSNISCVETPIQSDFQKLTSFGPVDNVVNTVCPSKVPGNKVIRVDESPSQNAYIMEYQVKPDGLPLRHLLTVFSLQAGFELITLTCQAKEENWSGKEQLFRNVVKSYKLKPRD